jgi:nucleoside-diphosphate-sugar epimerase
MNILITGAPGFVGRFIATHYLEAGHQIFAIARSAHGVTAEQRVVRAIEFVLGRELPSLANLHILEGDITQNNCGLSRANRDLLKEMEIDVIWHIASSSAFSEDKRTETFMTNVQGTSNVLSLCSFIKPKQLIFTSTTWACGKMNGTFGEDELPKAPEFNNAYEESKYICERMIADWSQDHAETIVQIMRPCIIVGDSRTGKTCCFTGYYYYMRVWVLLLSFLERMKSVMPKRDTENKIPLPIKVPGVSTAPLNIIPIDIAIDQMTKLADRAIPGTYNIAPEMPQTYGFWLEHGTRHIGFAGVTAADGKDGRVNDFMRLVLNRIVSGMSDYIPYISNPLDFSNSNTRMVLGADYVPCPEIDQSMIEMLLDYAIQKKFKE